MINNLSELLFLRDRTKIDEKVKIQYKRVHFKDYFKNSGYVKKILSIFEDRSKPDVIYYADNEYRELVCIDKEVFIVSQYKKKEYSKTYTLVQIDFTVPLNFKIIMVSNSKYNLYDYIKENNLVELKKTPDERLPSFSCGYGDIIIEILEALDKSNETYNSSDIKNILLKKLNLSKKYRNLLASKIRASNNTVKENEHELKKVSDIRIDRTLETIFENEKVDFLTLNQLLKTSKKYQ